MTGRLERFSEMTVLVVDDNETNLALLQVLLSREGLHHIITETDPRRVQQLLPQIDPDLILLDLHMPHLSGLAVLAGISRYAAGSYLPVLMVTADTTTEARNLALEQGAKDFLTKPLDHVEVVLRIANLLETRRLYSLLRAPTPNVEKPGTGTAAEQQPDGQRIHKLLREEGIVPFYQPIVETDSRTLVGQEALARFADPHPHGVAGWFAEAFQVGLGTELEWLAVRKAVPFLQVATPGTFLALNMSPATVQLLAERELCPPALCPLIVVELTEHVPIEDYSAVHRALEGIRSHGARLAADDLGSGYAGFRHLIALHPDIIKLDMSLVRGIHESPAQRALARALVAFAADVGAQVVGEGVEEAAELDVLRELAVPWAQGYHLGRPQPAPSDVDDAAGPAGSAQPEKENLVTAAAPGRRR